eukprot:1187203-Prorocentrum_minimum.AAC.2
MGGVLALDALNDAALCCFNESSIGEISSSLRLPSEVVFAVARDKPRPPASISARLALLIILDAASRFMLILDSRCIRARSSAATSSPHASEAELPVRLLPAPRLFFGSGSNGSPALPRPNQV